MKLLQVPQTESFLLKHHQKVPANFGKVRRENLSKDKSICFDPERAKNKKKRKRSEFESTEIGYEVEQESEDEVSTLSMTENTLEESKS